MAAIERKTPIYEEDPEIMAMTDEEILNEVLAMAGAWADREDMSDTWLEDLRAGWIDRLGTLYNEPTENPNI